MQSLAIRAAIAHLSNNRLPSKSDVVEKPQNLTESVEPEILNEELSEKHKKKIAAMPNTKPSMKNFHDKVFGENNDTVEIPYDRSEDPLVTHSNYQTEIQTHNHRSHHLSIFNHLARHGYQVTDYIGGYAVKTGVEKQRPEKIGKILSKTGGDEQITPITNKEGKNQTISQVFASDPIRAAKKGGKLIVTRSKEGVAGMSTDKGWESCMNLSDGCNRHYVPKDLEHGTLTAYLVKSGDEQKLDNPIGRVNLKPFHSSDDHIIMRPEKSIYGTLPRSAHKAITNWAKSVYPEKEDKIYVKNPSLYNDDGNSLHVTGNPSHEEFERQIHRQLEDIQRKHNIEVENGKVHPADIDSFHVKASSVLNKLPEQVKDKIAIHALLDNEDAPEINDGDYGYEDHEDIGKHIAHWANTTRMINYDSLSDKDLHTALETAHRNSKYSRNYDSDSLSNATYVHSKLQHQVHKRGSQELKDHMLSHIVDHGDKQSQDWYDKMEEDYGTHHLPHLHQMTNNGKLLEKMYDYGNEHDNEFVPKFENNADKIGFAHKIGRYGDTDFIHRFVNSEDYANLDHNELKKFHDGLNSNEHGEEISHHLISGLNLSGGVSEHGALLPHGKYDLSAIKAGHPHYEEAENVIDPNDLYSHIAKHSIFQSVKQSLKTRHDTQTPEIQDALNQNIHN